ncbi:MAG TPA: Na+/H+ antiporter NhaA [Gemmatimonadaceae bacterium]|nr:Na+/H+ antiporter NhaA [Gemmatimonadaceae bacterium]
MAGAALAEVAGTFLSFTTIPVANARASRLTLPVDPDRDHILGPPDAGMTLVEYGSYVCSYCHAAHEVIGHLRDRFGDRMRYVYRHLPLADRDEAKDAAELAEYTYATSGRFWDVHDELMRCGPDFEDGALDRIGTDYGVPPATERDPTIAQRATAHVRDDALSGLKSGARVTPTFFINGRRYEGAWDEAALSEAMLQSPGHRLRAASVDFARWAPSTGALLLLMTVLAVVISNTSGGPAFLAFWEKPLGLRFGGNTFTLSLLEWVNQGMLTIFFLVVGLEVKREVTVGRLAAPRAAAMPIAAATGGMIAPAVIYLLLVPAQFHHGWGATITTDTAFAVALIVMLGARVPVELRVFLTAAVIVDDLVAIAVVALFYSSELHAGWLVAAIGTTAAMVMLNRGRIYRALPYAVLGVLLWFTLFEAGIHATLAGVIVAMVTPTLPPANLSALMAQAQTVIDAETRYRGEAVMRSGPSASALHALDAVHDRIESPASKLLRAVEPWSSYAVLPVFALANAGLAWSSDIVHGHLRLIGAMAIALVVGKFAGIIAGARLAVRLGIAEKPAEYSWRQVAGAGALAGIGFTMSLFIAGQSFSGSNFAAAKVGIFLASAVAGVMGTAMLWTAGQADSDEDARLDQVLERGTPVSSVYEETV